MTLETFEEQAVENLIRVQMEEIEMLIIREEQKELKFIQDKMTEMLKNRTLQTQKMIIFSDETNIYVYSLKEINTQNGLSYTIIGSFSIEINEKTDLFEFPCNSHLISKANFEKYKK